MSRLGSRSPLRSMAMACFSASIFFCTLFDSAARNWGGQDVRPSVVPRPRATRVACMRLRPYSWRASGRRERAKASTRNDDVAHLVELTSGLFMKHDRRQAKRLPAPRPGCTMTGRTPRRSAAVALCAAFARKRERGERKGRTGGREKRSNCFFLPRLPSRASYRAPSSAPAPRAGQTRPRPC